MKARPGLEVILCRVLTFIGDRQRAIDVLLLQSPRAVVDFAGDPTRSLTVHLDGCGKRREKNKSQSIMWEQTLLDMVTGSLHLLAYFPQRPCSVPPTQDVINRGEYETEDGSQVTANMLTVTPTGNLQ